MGRLRCVGGRHADHGQGSPTSTSWTWPPRSKAAGSFVKASRWEEAAAAVVEGRWSEAAHAYERIGACPFAALAALHAAEAHAAAGRRAEAAGELARSLEFWRSVGARRYLREGEALLAGSA